MSDSIGQKLKHARQERHLSLEEVSEATRIRPYHLEALEANDYSRISSAVQARGFLHSYAEFLDLDIDQILAELHSNRARESGDEIAGPIPVAGNVSEAELVVAQAEVNIKTDAVPPAEAFWSGWLRGLRQFAQDHLGSKSAEIQPEEHQGQAPAQVVSEPKEALLSEGQGREEVSQAVQTEVAETGQSSQKPSLRLKEKARVLRQFGALWLGNLKAWQQSLLGKLGPGKLPGPDSEGEEDSLPDEQKLSSQEILDQIGAQLQQRREMLSLSLDEIEQHIHIRQYYLSALEAGDFDRLPSPVQTRGMLNNYAGFLDMDADALLLLFAEGLQARRQERHPERVVAGENLTRHRRQGLSPWRNFIASDLVFGAGMIILLLVIAIWGANRIINQRPSLEAESTAPSISDVLLATPVPSSEFAAGTTAPLSGASLPVQGTSALPVSTLADNVNVQLNIMAVERTFMRVTVDGEVKFDGRALPGSAYPFEGNDQIEVLTGNAAALQITYNQRDLGLMGNFGQVVDLVYSADSIATPTLAPTATGTPTQPVTPTPTPTPTGTSTVIPTP
jgi:cytoskeleton protein RodZ